MWFNSRIWSTGQDAVAVIKKNLMLLLPGVQVFLDVDDLEEIGALEEYIKRSQAILFFLSKGYFRSKNCLREVRSALQLKKPIILVQEADPGKGGGLLEELRADSPADLQPAIFDVGWPLVVWHRIVEFQYVSLKMISEALLLQTPHYALAKTLPLAVPGELTRQNLAFAKAVVLWASPANRRKKTWPTSSPPPTLAFVFVVRGRHRTGLRPSHGDCHRSNRCGGLGLAGIRPANCDRPTCCCTCAKRPGLTIIWRSRSRRY